MDDQKLQKLLSLMEMADADYASTEDVATIFAQIIEQVKSIKEECDLTCESISADQQSQLRDVLQRIESLKTTSAKELFKVKSALGGDINDVKQDLYKEIEGLRELISEIPQPETVDRQGIVSEAVAQAERNIKPLIPTLPKIKDYTEELQQVDKRINEIDRIAKANANALPITTTHFSKNGEQIGRAKNINFIEAEGTTLNLSIVGDTAQVTITPSGSEGFVTSVNGQVGDVSLGVSDLTDTNIINLQSGETLVWNGSEWVNQDASGFSGTEASVPFVGADGLLTEDNAHFKYLETEVQLQVGQDSPLWSGSTQDPIIAVGEVDSYLGVTVQNLSSGTGASTDLVASADNDDGTLLGGKYVNVGITSSTFNAGDVLYPPNTSYLASFGGNLNILAYSAGKQVNIITGGDTIDNLRATFQDALATILANYDTDICPAFTGGNWTGTNGWSVSGGELVKVSDAYVGTIEPSTPLTIAIGTTYKVTITASATSGAITYMLGGRAGSAITTGTTTSFIRATTTGNFIISGAISSTATITAIAIQPLIDNTGGLSVEGGLSLGSGIKTIGEEDVLSLDGDGVVTFDKLPLGPAGVAPTLDDELTPKFYVDGILTTGRFVGQLNAATTAALAACTYANGSSGVGATLTGNANGAFATIDGVAAALNNTYLIKNQASGLQNGAYKLTQVGDGSNPFILTRLTTYDTSSEIVTGSYFLVVAGTVNGSQQWGLITTGTITVGTTALVYEQLSASPVYTGGDGIDVTGTVIDVALASTPGLEFDSGALRAFTDETSIERSASGLRIKAGGVTNAMLAGGIEAPSSGAINSSNRIYVFAHTPLFVTLNGLIYYEDNGYTLSGLTLTFDSILTPATGSIIRSHY